MYKCACVCSHLWKGEVSQNYETSPFLGRPVLWCQGEAAPWVMQLLIYAQKHGQGGRQGEWLMWMTLGVAGASVHRCWLFTLSHTYHPFSIIFLFFFSCRVFFSPPPCFFLVWRRSGRYLLFKKYFWFVLVTCYFILDITVLFLFSPEFDVFSLRYLCLPAGSWMCVKPSLKGCGSGDARLKFCTKAVTFFSKSLWVFVCFVCFFCFWFLF